MRKVHGGLLDGDGGGDDGDDDRPGADAPAQAPRRAQPPPPPPSVKVGQAAPDFTLPYMAPKAGRRLRKQGR